jgi:hypothetical protein
VSNATVSSLDFVPTLLSLAGVSMPTDRVFDGIDISTVLLSGDDSAGHSTLFHPNSGSSGVDGKLDAVRWNHGDKQWKAIYQTGGAPDCTGSKGNVTTHSPPLLFELGGDPAEATALDVTQPEYAAAVTSIEALLATQMHSVNTQRRVVNYNVSISDEPCAHFPKSCRTSTAPSPPPDPPHSQPMCTAESWFNNTIPWQKTSPQPPFQNPISTCAATADLGCAYWTWLSSGNSCYLKTSVAMGNSRSEPGVTCGSIYPVR